MFEKCFVFTLQKRQFFITTSQARHIFEHRNFVKSSRSQFITATSLPLLIQFHLKVTFYFFS